MTVSTVLWCDAGDHAFKGGRPGSQSVQGTEINEEGNAVSVQQDVCPECAVEARQRRVVQAIETVKPEACPVCDKTALVYSKHAGSNQCMECGYNSNDVPVTKTLNRTYGESARRYMSDDRPEAG
jgi:ribosomal protein L37AE/L43A